MKRFFSCLLCVVMIMASCITFTSCATVKENVNVWENAMYTEDKTLGDGADTITVKLIADGKSVVFTINTDKDTLGDALTEHKLISGEKGAYGLYVKKVNGIEADYDKTQTYWGFTKNGESMLTGVDAEKVSDGNEYEITYIKDNASSK